jgi:DNA-binding NarL/FixJ family response regulator
MLRVVLAEDSYLVREGVRLLLDAVEEIDLVATCASLPDLLDTVAALEPDVVLTDIRMPPTGTDEGIRAAEQLRTSHPGVGVVVLSQYVEPSFAVGLFAAGSGGRAYLLKERVGDVDELLRAIRTVAQGGSVMDPAVVDALVAARRSRPSVLDRLTAREAEVLAQIATGRNNAAIAKALVLSERAVEKHINSIFAKLELTAEPDMHRRVRAVLLYLAAGEGSASITGG